MTLLSLFMTSTGIFCFVPISQRLIESGIIPTSDSWRLPSLLAPTFYAHNEKIHAADGVKNAGLEDKVPLYPVDETFTIDKLPTVLHANGGWSTGMISPLRCSPASSPLQSPIDTFYGHESTSFISDSTLCDSCNTLLRGEIPPDHIPSVIRALALFEAQDRSPNVVFGECEVAALTNAFSMLRL